MRKFLLIPLSLCLMAAGPTQPHKEPTTEREFINVYKDLRNVPRVTHRTPASASAACNQGEIAWDSSFVYVCISTSTWKRVAISTW